MTDGQLASSGIGAGAQGAQAGASFGPWGALIGGAVGTLAGGIGVGIGNAKAKKEAERLNYQGQYANETFMKNFENSVMNVGINNKNQALLNIAAFGGPLSANPFSNGVRFIEEGGSHEQNPIGGVPQGIAPDGQPNLVEEGEVIFNDYVYSKRLKVPKKDYEMLGLKDKKEYTFADAAEAIQKESEERPNDPLSKKNMEAMFARLQGSQDELKAKREAMKLKREFDKLSSEEQAYMLQAMMQPQQEAPIQEQMEPQQVQVAANGGKLGHRFDYWSDLSWEDAVPSIQDGQYIIQKTTPGGALQYASVTGDPLKASGIYNSGTDDSPIWTLGVAPKEPTVTTYWNNTKDTDWNAKMPTAEDGQYVVQRTTDSGQTLYHLATGDPTKASGIYQDKQGNWIVGDKPTSGLSSTQLLRAMPAIGSGVGALISMFDKPNYSNIERAERASNKVPNVSPTLISNRMSYNPLDVNYLLTQMGNQNIGNRRAIIENTAGNTSAALSGLLSSNYKGQLAMVDAFRQAYDYNNTQKKQVDEFNRGTDTFNSEQSLKANIQNQNITAAKADFLMKTGQLRDAELSALQAGRSAALSSFLTNLGNLGQDKLSREQLQALIATGAYNQLSDEMKEGAQQAGIITAFGGKLKKKGGKHA